jgi:tetratricopeptide (TPR) repeat protein
MHVPVDAHTTTPGAAATLGALALIALTLCAAPAAAKTAAEGDVRVDIQLSPEVVELGSTFTYTVTATVKGNKTIRMVEEPDFSAFSVVGRSQMPQFTIRNGVSERRLTLQYRLRTRRRGDAIPIKPPTLVVGGQRFSGETLNIKVVERGKAPKNQVAPVKTDAAFISVELSPKERKPFIGEQITLQYELFQDIHRMVGELKTAPDDPSLDDFWIEELNPKERFTQSTVRSGRKLLHRVQLGRYALFPLKAGKASIEPLELELVQSGFMSAGRAVPLRSEPLEIDVQPLPPGAPDDFSEGNVGTWNLFVTTDTLRARVGAPLTIRVAVKGQGQVGRLTLPVMPEIPGARVIGSEENVETGVSDLRITGEKYATYTIMPTEQQDLEIPPLRFTYFNPETGAYETKQSTALTVKVAAGTLPPEREVEEEPVERRAASGERDVLGALRSELRGVRPIDTLRRETDAPPFQTQPWFIALLALPLLGFFGVTLGPHVARSAARDNPARRRKRAAKAALDSLPDHTPPDSHAQVLAAIKSYATEALELSSGVVTESELPKRLRRLGAPDGAARQLGDALAACNKARFSTDATRDPAELDALARSVREAIRAIEDARASGDLKLSSSSAAAALLSVAFGVGAALAAPTPAHAQDAAALAERAQAAQRDRDFDAAADLWRQVAKDHPSDPAVLYNLGTSELQLERLGPARLALERAALHAPGDTMIQDNLDVARRMVRVTTLERMGGRTSVLGAQGDLASWDLARRVTSRALAIALLVSLWALFGAALWRWRTRDDSTRDLLGVTCVLAALLATVAAASWYARADVVDAVTPAIILSESPSAREGPSPHAAERPIRQALPPGTRLASEEERDGWVKLRLPDGSAAWFPEADVGMVR